MTETPADMHHDPKLVYDLGLHHGLDTRFYLDKGFRVVGVEANPEMAAAARNAFAAEIAEGRLSLVDKALWHRTGETIPFYLNDAKDDWCSAFKGWAEKGGHASREIRVETRTLTDLFESFGRPYYVKCDIEGADELVMRQLLWSGVRPAYVSVEAGSLEVLALLYAAGYDRVQIVNQAFLPFNPPPEPTSEGTHVPVTFNGYMSGPFGRDLAPQKWLDYEAAVEAYLLFNRLNRMDDGLAHGWLDFHVTRAETLAAADREARASAA